ncbi:MAG: thiamine phosphate synthase [Pseudomonadota bacterium]
MRLNLASRTAPPLLFLTDVARVPSPERVAEALPPGCGVILRDYDAPERKVMGERLAAICRRRGLVFLVGADMALANDLGADGVHFPEGLYDRIPPVSLRGDMILTGAAHGPAAIRRAVKKSIDAVLLSPVFATRSHPGASSLGRHRVAAIAGAAPLPVYALGGIDAQSVRRLPHGLAGVGVIGALG